jgi:diguanylate cyclase (GGDEF)-like protein
MASEQIKPNKSFEYPELEPETLEDAQEIIEYLTAYIKKVRGDEDSPELQGPIKWPQTLPEAFIVIHGLTDVIERNRHDDLLPTMLKRSEIIHNIQGRCKNNKKFGVVVIDLDNFKQVNDAFRHIVGDTVLKEFARLLATKFRRANELKLDLIDKNESATGRLGGDEAVITFAFSEVENGLEGQKRVTSPEVQMKAAEEEIRLIGEELIATFPQLEEVGFGISLGGVIFDPNLPTNAETLLAEADELASKDKLTREYVWFNGLTQAEQDEIRDLRVRIRKSPMTDRRVPKTFAALDMFEPLPE